MPFARENIKFTILVCAFVVLCGFGIIGVVAASYSPKESTPLYTAITGFVMIFAGQVMTALRNELSVREAKHEIKQDINAVGLKAVVHAKEAAVTAEEVKKELEKVVAVDCPPDDQPFSPCQLRMITEIVKQVCEKLGPPAPEQSTTQSETPR